jgi:predicted MPP superfamily phosphohydrolase
MSDDPAPASSAVAPKTEKRKLFCRRRFLKMAGVLTAAAAPVWLYTWRIEPHWVEVVERDLPIEGLPSSLQGRRLIQLSDLHVGPVVDFDYLTASVKTVNRLQPDLIALTGDFMSAFETEQADQVARLLEGIQKPPLGCFAILGNHDYGHQWSNPRVADNLVRRLTDLGITTLRNEMRSVEGLQLVGLDDFWGTNFDARKAFSTVDWTKPALTLCHNPDAVDLDEFKVCRGWVLSGHTHGGQCKPPFLPPPMLPVKNKRYTAGEFDLGGGRRLYINRGLGYLKRVRFNVRPEITCFRMTGTA